MKKLSAIFCTALIFSNAANATGFYVGADALVADANHKAKNISTTSGPKNNDKQGDTKLNYGVNAGFRIDLLNLYGSAELFYDNLQTSARNFQSSAEQISSDGSSTELKNRYGAKANLGFAILPRITPFITYGLTNVNYSSNVFSSNQSISKSKLTPLYGAGLILDLPFGVSLKASYDYQQFNIRYAESGSKIKTNLGVAKLGVIYNF
ncbi:MAG: porin family protein [Proteobacteria bacterium]|nr:porin family protein [Pseudomonadota bacterium]